MDIEATFDDDLVRRLPLPLAQLYRRAHNAKTPLDRHNAAYCLWEAALKLLGSAAIVAYAERGRAGARAGASGSRTWRGRPWDTGGSSSGSWCRSLADAGDEGFRPARDLVLGRGRDDLPRAAGLDAALREDLDGAGGARATVRLTELFDRLVRYRNHEIGHGAPGQRDGRVLRPDGPGAPARRGRGPRPARRAGRPAADLRRRRPPPAVRRLADRALRADRRDRPAARVAGAARVRGRPPAAPAAALPRRRRATPDRRRPGRLHPLVLYDHDAAEVFFLNARRGQRRTEYLCYHPGRSSSAPTSAPSSASCWRGSWACAVDGAQVEQWAAQLAGRGAAGAASARKGRSARRLGEFELLSELGRGGMGIVYRAWQPSLGRQVALKCLLRAGDPKAEARFHREIHALGRVEHPNLVKVFTSGAEADQWFYAMELVEGATLGAVCGQLQGRGSGASDVDLETWHATLSTACQEARAAERPLSDARRRRAAGPPADTDRPRPRRRPAAATTSGTSSSWSARRPRRRTRCTRPASSTATSSPTTSW